MVGNGSRARAIRRDYRAAAIARMTAGRSLLSSARGLPPAITEQQIRARLDRSRRSYGGMLPTPTPTAD